MDFQKTGIFFCLTALFFSACTARITGDLEAGGSGEFEVSASLMPRISLLIRSLSAALGDGTAPEHIIDGEAIARSMSAAPGIASVSFRNTGPAAIEGPVKISRLEDFLSAASGSGGARKGFITLEQASPGGHCTITIDRESGPEILSLISADVSDYLSALMAPIATGERLSKEEYFELVASIYGRPLADEISRGSIRAFINFPGPVSAVQGGTWTGRRAEFTVPLADLLVLETPLVYEVWWK
ncbi:MAG: hypothetical protein LBK02_10040 [Treponema sp.]|jgi:hypothetical protein|nr:hypothetical protein [Treponema sp.]